MIPPDARILTLTKASAAATPISQLEDFDIVLVENPDGDFKMLKNVWSPVLITVSKEFMEEIMKTFGVRGVT